MNKQLTYIQDKDILENLESYFNEYSQPVLLVDPFIMDKYNSIFTELGNNYPIRSNTENIQSDCIIGIGGGRIMDNAKHLAYLLKCDCILMPTSPATDAPCTDICVVDNKYIKSGFPTKVLADENILSNVPSRLLISGLGDALSTYFEAITYPMNTMISDLSQSCLDTIMSNGIKAVNDLKDSILSDELKSCIHSIIYTSGIVYAHTGGYIAHKLASIFQSHTPKTMHGELVAFFLLVQLHLENHQLFSDVYDFCKAVGLPTTLKQINLENISDIDFKTDLNFTNEEILNAVYHVDKIY